MCILCECYGTDPIEDDNNLEKALSVAAAYIEKFGEKEHVMEVFVARILGGDDFEEDPEMVGDWERNRRDRG